MPYQRIGSGDNGDATAGLTLGTSLTCLAGERVRVRTNCGGTPTTETVTDNSGTNVYTQVGSRIATASGGTYAYYECQSVVGGTFTLTQTLTGTPLSFRGIQFVRSTGLSGASIVVGLAQTAMSTAKNAIRSGDLTPGADIGILSGWTYDESGFALQEGLDFEPGVTFPTEASVNGASSLYEDRRVTSKTLVSATFTTPSGAENTATFGLWCAEVAVPANPGPPQIVSPRRRMRAPIGLYSPASTFGRIEGRRWFYKDLPTQGGSGVTTISATPGAWTWAGTAASSTQLIAAIPGTWSWAGTVASTNQVIAAIAGAWSWAGTAASFSQLVNATAGAWSWAGAQATLTQLINATPGAWTWAGVSASQNQLIAATPGAWSWAGVTANIGTPINATPGSYTWAGVPVELPTQIPAIPAAWSWAGISAASSQLIAATPGAYTWAGVQTSITQALNATPGSWVWTGIAAGVIQALTLDVMPGSFTWQGMPASIEVPQDLNAIIADLERQLARARKLARGGWVKRHDHEKRDVTKNNQIIMALVGAVVRGFPTPEKDEE